jgi:cytochrome c biogenesis protein CcmG/thiol:disulfide interchange protein DsbE
LLIVLGWSLFHSSQGSVKVGDSIQPIEIKAFDGQTLNTGSDVYKGKVLVINFWASWCGPCASEAATLQQAWSGYANGGKVQFIGVDYVDTEAEAKATIAKYGITFPNGPDLETKISKYFRIQGVPETYIIDPNGKLAYVQVGAFESVSEIQKIIDPLIGK